VSSPVGALNRGKFRVAGRLYGGDNRFRAGNGSPGPAPPDRRAGIPLPVAKSFAGLVRAVAKLAKSVEHAVDSYCSGTLLRPTVAEMSRKRAACMVNISLRSGDLPT
jgi:hypothetical protein